MSYKPVCVVCWQWVTSLCVWSAGNCVEIENLHVYIKAKCYTKCVSLYSTAMICNSTANSVCTKWVKSKYFGKPNSSWMKSFLADALISLPLCMSSGGSEDFWDHYSPSEWNLRHCWIVKTTGILWRLLGLLDWLPGSHMSRNTLCKGRNQTTGVGLIQESNEGN